MRTWRTILGPTLCAGALWGCAGATNQFRDASMDFGSMRAVAVMPLENLSQDMRAAERVRDVIATTLLASGAFYVVPDGEVTRGLARTSIQNPRALSAEEAVKLGSLISVEGILIGTVKEYGEVRSGNSSSNVVSVSLQLMETQTGRVVWSASATRGGISVWDRLLGGGGRPMDPITEQVANDLLDALFR